MAEHLIALYFYSRLMASDAYQHVYCWDRGIVEWYILVAILRAWKTEPSTASYNSGVQ